MGWLLLNFILTVSVPISATYRDGPKLPGVHRFISEPEIPDECVNKAYCENVPNYPKKIAARLITMLQRRDIKDFNLNSSVLKGSEDTLPLCAVNKTTVTPKAAKDSYGRWHFVLNQQTDPVQQFEAVICVQGSHNNPISCEGQMFISGAFTICQQKNTTIDLVTFNHVGISSTKRFQVPCCCSCEAAIKEK